ncbi:hypothetical protein, partial [Herbaspirillum sp.]|uniref:hypothetical protein n=1 Tax=Herbaspirillum sp. TaxID=1890675 RepID=UPI002585FE5B
SGGTVYGATPGTTGSWSSLEAISTATVLSAAHYNDRHYIGLGGVNRVLESDGTLRQWGMQAPTAAPVAVASDTSGGELEADADTEETVTGFDNPELAYDGDTSTFASAEISTGSSSVLELSFSDTDAAGSRIAEMTWSLGLPGAQAGPIRNASGDVISDTGAEAPLNVRASVLIEYSENDGADWTQLYSVNTKNPQQLNTIKKSIATAANLSTTVRVRFTVAHVSGTGQGVFRVYRVRATRGSSTAIFDTTAGGMLYAIGEYSETYDLYSPISTTVLIEMDDDNVVTITLPTTAENAIATHYVIYRTADGGSINELGIIGTAIVGETSWIDDFSEFTAIQQPTRLVRTIRIADPATGTLLPFPMDTPPPAFTAVRYYKGSLVGFRADDPRAMNFNIPGQPESWPEVYVYTKFPLPEHDQLVTMEENAGSLIIGAKDAIIRMDDLPRASAGVFDAPIVQLKGAPGCVGRQAMASVNVPGHSRVCWISNEGIFITDG